MSKQMVFEESRIDALGEASDGTYPVTLLTPGQGSSAYYSEEVIRRDAPTAFPKGTHVYLGHLREDETRSAEKILGTLIEDTTIRESDGAAINRFKPVSRWAPLVEDVHKIAGLSINAAGTAKIKVLDGKATRVAESIEYHVTNSVDLVSYPGRPGSGFTESYDALYEKAMADARAENEVQTETPAPGVQKEESNMELEEKVDKLTESLTALRTLVESALPKAPAAEEFDAEADRAAAIAAVRAVESAEVPASVKDRLVEGIRTGNYEVQAEIDSIIALREELKTEVETKFNESHGIVGAAGASGSGEAPKVIGWGS